MSKRDYYEVLGVVRGASDADLKAAFRKPADLALKISSPGAERAWDQQKRSAFPGLFGVHRLAGQRDCRHNQCCLGSAKT